MSRAVLSKQARLRRDRDTLMVAGGGVMAFGFWSVIKSISFLLFNTDYVREQLGDTGEVPEGLLLALTYLFVGLVLLADLAFRLFIGRSARAEAGGRRRGWVYLAAAGILCVMYAVSVPAAFALGGTTDLLDTVISALVDLTSAVMLLELIIAAVRVKREQRAGAG